MTDPVVADALSETVRIKERIDEFFEEANYALSVVPDDIPGVGGAVSGLRMLVSACESMWEGVEDIIQNTGSPSRLNNRATGWKSDVGAVLNDIAGTIDPAKLETSTEWEGSGGKAYLDLVPAQGDMLIGLKDAASELTGALREIADAIETFWWMFGATVLLLGIGLSAAIAEAITVVGIPAAVATALTAVGGAASTFIGLLFALKNTYDVIELKQEALAEQVDTLGKEWPKATKKNAGKMTDGQQWDPITED